ncbi:MAG TPA: S-methyl-5-thioribose-1-phosphate isomerase [Thermoleophilia bacterium]|nr:S-methyl-5-thioribose-1-phosphate isomerase [Thermoleophilia bacterium]
MRVRTVEIQPGAVVLIDQLALPQREMYVTCRDWREVADRIGDMTVRGAPAIGVTAAGGVALAAAEAAAARPTDPAAVRAALEQAASGLLATRPTAVNLRWALDEMRRAWEQALAAPQATPAAVAAELLARAQAIHDDDIDRCLRIGEHGAALFAAGDRILTHCNAGALATAGYGTALGVIRSAAARYPDISVWVDETRPWLQGARLTAWELQVEGIPYRLISDNMAGYFMRLGEIEGVVVGADRIAANGDTANKIGTYSVSVLAKEHGVPFYVAAPLSTVDLTIESGDSVPIEERDPAEVTAFRGTQVAPEGASARHPAFDVTPAANIVAIVTEAGVLRPPFGPALAGACASGECRP